MTTDYARGFRAGVEAAAEHLESEAAEYRRRGRNLWSLDREVAAKEIRALAPAAPEPSEEAVRRVAIAISGAPFPSKRSMEKARAALAAMGRGDA